MYYFFGFILAIIILVFVHEFGHFITAKIFGVRVLNFAIGFGKIIFCKTYKGTCYSIRLIPLGGFVEMLNCNKVNKFITTSGSDGKLSKQKKDLLLSACFDAQPTYRKILIVLAGPAINFLLAIIIFALILIIGEKDFKTHLAPIKEGTVLYKTLNNYYVDILHILPKSDDFKGWQIVSVNHKPVIGWQEVHSKLLDSILTDNKKFRLGLQNNNLSNKLSINLVMDLSQFSIDSISKKNFFKNLGLQIKPIQITPVVHAVQPNSPAANVLQKGDLIVEFAQTPVQYFKQLTQLVEKYKNQEVQIKYVRKHNNEPTSLASNLNTETIIINKVKISSRILAGKEVGFLGIVVDTQKAIAEYTVTKKHTFLNASIKAGLKVWQLTKNIITVIVDMATGKASLDNISGPITIAEVSGKTLAVSWNDFFLFLAFLSVSLGIINLLPIPILDGGQILIYSFEGIMQNKISQQSLGVINKIGFLFLAAIMLLGIYNDIFRHFILQ